MEQSDKDLIMAKIDELKEIAKRTNSVLFLIMQERDEKGGRHFCGYGSGVEIRDLLQDAVDKYPNVKTIVGNIKIS